MSDDPEQPKYDGILFHPALRYAGDPTTDYDSVSKTYGTKVAGLSILPASWVPPYVAIPARVFNETAANPDDWMDSARRHGVDIDDALRTVSEDGRYPLIARSSAVGEALEDRGRYKSLQLDVEGTVGNLEQSISEIVKDFATRERHQEIAICIQRYVAPELAGHVSNEVRVSPTRNQWELETASLALDRGINSKFAARPGEGDPLRVSTPEDIIRALRGVCHWVNENVAYRAHLEWCSADGRLWIVQLDREHPTSAGIDPRQMPDATGYQLRDETIQGGVFDRFMIERPSPWGKLENVRDFWTSKEKPPHRLFFATGDALMRLLETPTGTAALSAEIDELTGGHAVLRTSCKDPSVKRSNLPRTHTVDGTTAVQWIPETLAFMSEKGAAANDVAIILHRYIPARSAAWTYYAPGTEIVQLDCIWGLPDGLQFLTHDSFQLDARTGSELAADIRFKPYVLQEQTNGTWSYVQVARQHGRRRVLSRVSMKTLALHTVEISEKIGGAAQVMWFCDLPSELGLGIHLPWYRTNEFAEFARTKRPAMPEFRVSTEADIDGLEASEGEAIIVLAPDVELVRDDDSFLDRVVAIARERRLPVELDGSVLGHAYYRLRDAGILVLTPHSKYDRVRGRQLHNKVVRDDIPQNIVAKGERVRVARLAEHEAGTALIGKLFEEALELRRASTQPQKVEELADLLEVVRGLADANQVQWDEVNLTAVLKRQERGGFAQQTVLLETTRAMPRRGIDERVDTDPSGRLVQLRDLGTLRVHGTEASISFTKLLAGEPVSVELMIDGQAVNLNVSIDGTGVAIQGSELTPGPPTDAQLTLFGMDDESQEKGV